MDQYLMHENFVVNGLKEHRLIGVSRILASSERFSVDISVADSWIKDFGVVVGSKLRMAITRKLDLGESYGGTPGDQTLIKQGTRHDNDLSYWFPSLDVNYIFGNQMEPTVLDQYDYAVSGTVDEFSQEAGPPLKVKINATFFTSEMKLTGHPDPIHAINLQKGQQLFFLMKYVEQQDADSK